MTVYKKRLSHHFLSLFFFTSAQTLEDELKESGEKLTTKSKNNQRLKSAITVKNLPYTRMNVKYIGSACKFIFWLAFDLSPQNLSLHAKMSASSSSFLFQFLFQLLSAPPSYILFYQVFLKQNYKVSSLKTQLFQRKTCGNSYKSTLISEILCKSHNLCALCTYDLCEWHANNPS